MAVVQYKQERRREGDTQRPGLMAWEEVRLSGLLKRLDKPQAKQAAKQARGRNESAETW